MCASHMLFHSLPSSILKYTPTSVHVFDMLLVLNCAAQNNCVTRHLAKILIHLGWCLHELVSSSGGPSVVLNKAVNALHISSVFLKHLIENSKGNIYEELCLSVDGVEELPDSFPRGNYTVMVLNSLFFNMKNSKLFLILDC